MFRLTAILILFLMFSDLSAQNPAAINKNADSTATDTIAIKKQDSVRRPKISQKQDSVKRPRILREWTLSRDYTEEVSIPVDTVFSLAHRYRLADKYSSLNATLGNYGLPFYQINFFDRISDPDKFLYAYYYPLMWLPDKAIFMNTQVPFTELDWTFAGPRETSEQTFRIRHSQNVNRFLNFGLIYDIVFSLGQYNFQRAEDKDFVFYSSYTREKYKLYFSAGINNITSYENGGIANEADLGQKSNTREIQVNLEKTSSALSMLKNRNLLLVQRYTLSGKPAKSDSTGIHGSGFFGLSGTFSHIFTIDGNKRTYSDQYPESGFYDTVFINRGKKPVSPVFDSLSSRNIKNTLRFDFTTDETRKFRLGGGVGIRNELFRYSQIIPTHDTTSNDTFAIRKIIPVWKRSSTAVIGKLYNSIGEKFAWVANGELYLTGYRAGDLDLNGEIRKSFDWKKGRASWLITGEMSSRQPSFWFQQWGSTFFEWNENLKKEFRINVGTRFTYPGRKADIRFNYAIIDNYTAFDSTAHPSQFTGGLSVASLSVSKDLHLWKFHLTSDLLLQTSSNPHVLSLPLVALRSAAYFQHEFRFASTGGRLNTQLGADVLWNSEYYPYGYMPATGRFYRQERVKEGNYPYINVFFNFKVKRTRLFVMFDHVNSGFMGYNYYMVPSYPLNTRMLRYGLAWTFYD